MLIQHHKASEYSDRTLDQFEQIYADSATSARHGAGRAPLHHGRATPGSWSSPAVPFGRAIAFPLLGDL
jgi:hypothetical protein